MNTGQIIQPDDLVLITGASGFIGARLVERLVARGLRNIRCFARPSSNTSRLEAAIAGVRRDHGARVELVTGNLLSRDDCAAAVNGVAVVYHLAAARGEKSIPDAFMNSVVTTRNLLDACLRSNTLRRLVAVSSFSVYSNQNNPKGRLLDESATVDTPAAVRNDAYAFAKVKQDEIVREYGAEKKLPYVMVRPGYVYGEGNEKITGRVGVDTLGIFMHMGGSNPIPFTFIDNCADAIALAGLVPGVEGEIFNIVDDDLPSSRSFLRQYKRNVKRFRSIWVPKAASLALCALWENYSNWSQGQLPPAFNRRGWHAYWKKTRYSNEKAKRQLGWQPIVPAARAMELYFESCRQKLRVAAAR
jgi:nucleoside-diphosphate-sugar epimerase